MYMIRRFLILWLQGEVCGGFEAFYGGESSDGVIIYSVYGEKRDKVVLIRQYRYTIGGYIYEFPAGLVELGRISMRVLCVRCLRRPG